MVCVDGFILTHSIERVDIPEQEQVDRMVPPFEPRQVLDPDDPVSIGAMVGPEAFTEVRYLAQVRMRRALEVIPEIAEHNAEVLGRLAGGLLHPYRTEDADVVVVAMGSVLGTIKDVADGLRDEGLRIGVLGISCFRPFPVEQVRSALGSASRIIVVEKAFSIGYGGILSTDIAMALAGRTAPIHTVVAGLGGRPVWAASLKKLFLEAVEGILDETVFCDLNTDLVEAEIERMALSRRSGPPAENVLRDLANQTGGVR
jgi:pyruvate ferredoxin oxidoreductase alpha subunit